MNHKRRILPKAVRPLEQLDDRITPAVASVTNPFASAMIAAPASAHIVTVNVNASNGLLVGPFVPGQGGVAATITANTAILRSLPRPQTSVFASRPNTLGATTTALGTTTVVNNSLLTGSINTGMTSLNSPLGQLLSSPVTAFNSGVNGNTILALGSIFGQTNGAGNVFFNPNPSSATGLGLNSSITSLGTQNFNGSLPGNVFFNPNLPVTGLPPAMQTFTGSGNVFFNPNP
jgi:hypothetical protein